MTEENVSIEGLNKADVLAALYNASRPQGMGFMKYDPAPMTRSEAQKILDSGQVYFDYLRGRVMKLDLSGNDIDAWGFDRDNGHGVVARVINELREKQSVNTDAISEIHAKGTVTSADETYQAMREGISVRDTESEREVTMGLAGAARDLRPKVSKAKAGAVEKLRPKQRGI